MIVDRLENWPLYPFGPAWRSAFEYLQGLTAETPDGLYEIAGDAIYAVVMSYATRSEDEAVLEAHRRYVDIQSVLRGQEGFAWFPVPALAVAQPYEAEKDAEFYHCLEPAPARIAIDPQRFIALFPEDAHMPTLMLGDRSEMIKKVVVKIRLDLLSADFKVR